MDVIIATISLTTTFLLLVAFFIALSNSPKIGKNKVHFYVTRDSAPLSKGLLNLWINKPDRGVDIWYTGKSWARHIAVGNDLRLFRLNLSDYDSLKWEDEPKEVFLNLED